MSETTPEPQPTEPIPTEPEPEPTPETPEEGESNPPAEGDIPEEPAQAEPETEPPQTEGLSQAEWEARFAKTDKAYSNYTKAIERIWEEDALPLIPLTISPSAPPGFLHPQDAGRIPDEVKLPLLDFLGITQEAEYEIDRTRPACEKCKGKGKVRTGSEVPEFRTLICDVCQGRGFMQPGGTQANGPGATELVPVPVGAEPSDLPQGDVDGWGIARLLPDGMPNPNFGRTPQYWDTNFPTGNVG
jgi:hypothetical protein